MKRTPLSLLFMAALGCSHVGTSRPPGVDEAGTSCHSWHTPPDRWSRPRVYHGPFEAEFESQIGLSHHSHEELKGEWRKSPNDAYAFVVRESDRTKPGPWTFEYLIDTEREQLLKLTVSDYKFTRARWINEKLSCWM